MRHLLAPGHHRVALPMKCPLEILQPPLPHSGPPSLRDLSCWWYLTKMQLTYINFIL